MPGPQTALLVASAALVSPRVVRNSDFDARVIVRHADERPTIKHVLASLVRVASGPHHRPSRTSATNLAPKRRKEMDRRHDQRFGIAMGLSEDSEVAYLVVGQMLAK